MTNFTSVRIVLVGITHPGNIGSAARAMKTMGLRRLYLVSPKMFPHQHATELASGADDVLAEAVVVDTLEDALHDCQCAFATSARPRHIYLPEVTPSQCAAMVAEHSLSQEIAIVFGREHAGLTNEEFLRCHHHVFIPTDPTFGSLNVAQAVQIMAYALREKWLSAPCVSVPSSKVSVLATSDAMERFYIHLQTILIAIDFLKPSNPKRLMQRLRRLFNRAALEETEVNMLRGILTQIAGSIAPSIIKEK